MDKEIQRCGWMLGRDAGQCERAGFNKQVDIDMSQKEVVRYLCQQHNEDLEMCRKIAKERDR